MNNKIVYILIAFLGLTSCEDLFEPAIENIRDLEDAYEEATYAEGLLINGYIRIPTLNWSFNDVATDDAVSNDINNAYRQAATGRWASNYDPFTQWQRSRSAIQYLNIFLTEADKVEWATDPDIKELYNRRLKGEAYGLRALHMYYLLQAHSGEAEGNLLGVPLVLSPETPDSDFNIPRDTFKNCFNQLLSDLDRAEQMLALDFEDITDPSLLPSGLTDINDYNRVFGERGRQRMSGRLAKAIRARSSSVILTSLPPRSFSAAIFLVASLMPLAPPDERAASSVSVVNAFCDPLIACTLNAAMASENAWSDVTFAHAPAVFAAPIAQFFHPLGGLFQQTGPTPV